MVKHDQLLFTKVYKKERQNNNNNNTNNNIEDTKLRSVLQLAAQSYESEISAEEDHINQ